MSLIKLKRRKPMSKRVKILFCALVAAAAVLLVFQVPLWRPTVAQPSPDPNPKPTPSPTVGSCCGIMIPAGHTIGGPGRGFQDIFMSHKPKDICATIKNEDAEEIRVAFYATLTLADDGGFGFSDPIISRDLFIGETATICADRVKVVSVGCRRGGVDCRMFSWRVDSAQ